MSTHESRQSRLVKARGVRRSERPVRIGDGAEEARDELEPDEGPSVRAEKDGDGRVTALVVTCSCGETIRGNCHYSGDEDHETAQA